MKFICGMQINMEGFYKLILSFWVCATRHAQITQNKKLHIVVISLKNHGIEVDFLPSVKDKGFLQDYIILGFFKYYHCRCA